MRRVCNMKKICTIILIAVWLNLTIPTKATQKKKQTSVNKKTYALVVGGISKDPQDRSNKSKVISDVKKLLLNNPEITSQTLTVLTADDVGAVREPPLQNYSSGKSTVENIQKAIKAIASSARVDDKFVFYYIGQANVIGDKLRFNLPGKDITQEQLTQWIKEIQASSMLIVLDCPASGLAAKAVSGQGRIVICSCTAQQRYSTRFSEYFIPAFADNRTDTNGDGKISVLEAFTRVSREVDDWYRQKKLLTTETPVLEDNGDGLPSQQPWRYQLDETDGLAASQFFLMRK